MKRFDTVILGSGYFSLGYAMIAPNTLIIERTQLCDPNFGGTLCGFRIDSNSILDVETERLRDFYAKHGLIKGNAFNASVSEAGISAYALNSNAEFLFGSEYIKIENNGSDYEVTVFNNGGFERICAKKVIDARRECGKTLSVLCRGEISAESLIQSNDFKLTVTGAFQELECVVGFHFLNEIDVNSAKVKAIRYLEAHLPPISAKIVQCAYLMHNDAHLPCFTDGDIPMVRDISYGNVIGAFDAGVKYAKEVCAK